MQWPESRVNKVCEYLVPLKLHNQEAKVESCYGGEKMTFKMRI